jgi:chromosome partition protein MukF
MSSDPSRLIAALARDPINLDLKTLDLCFLAGLYLRAARASLASFEEDVLIDMFEQICDVVNPSAERPRAAHNAMSLSTSDVLASRSP